jgi:hypothetical protein
MTHIDDGGRAMGSLGTFVVESGILPLATCDGRR